MGRGRARLARVRRLRPCRVRVWSPVFLLVGAGLGGFGRGRCLLDAAAGPFHPQVAEWVDLFEQHDRLTVELQQAEEAGDHLGDVLAVGDQVGEAQGARLRQPDPQDARGLPDLTEDEALYSALEALLLVVDSPAEVETLADALDEPVKRIRAALKAMAAQYHEQNRGIDLRDAGGGWRFYTRDKYAPFVEKLLHDGQRAKLTRAALESLAVIAYRQPVTRARVAAVRGVNVDGVIRTLLARGLIEETGTDKDTGGILYRTTELFLERLGLSSLEDLPPIAPLLPEVDAIDDV